MQTYHGKIAKYLNNTLKQRSFDQINKGKKYPFQQLYLRIYDIPKLFVQKHHIWHWVSLWELTHIAITLLLSQWHPPPTANKSPDVYCQDFAGNELFLPSRSHCSIVLKFSSSSKRLCRLARYFFLYRYITMFSTPTKHFSIWEPHYLSVNGSELHKVWPGCSLTHSLL